MNENIVIHNRDIYSEIEIIQDGSINLIVIDPPYEMREFGYTKNAKPDSVEFKYFQKRPHINALNSDFIGLRNAFDFEYMLTQFKRIQPFLNAYIFCNAKLLQIMLSHLYSIGNTTIEILCYHKTNAMPSYKLHYNNDMEYILFLCDDKKSLDFGNIAPMKRASKLYQGNCQGYKLTKHPTEKPLSLIEKLVLNSSKEGDLVLDCFSGSGTTAHICKLHNRRFLGYEINKKYYDMSLNRLSGVQGDLFQTQ